MAFLFQDQNQGTRNDKPTQMREPTRPFSFIRTLTVGFGVTPNLLTLLPKQNAKKALAGSGYLTLTAGGEFHPALRTSAARDERPGTSMAKAASAIKNLPHGEGACPHVQISMCKSAIGTRLIRAPGCAHPARRTRMPRIRFRFVLIAKVNVAEELWTSRGLPVDGLRGRLRRFRKSHHLMRAGSGNPAGLQLAAARRTRVGLLRV